jgi:acid phosphatase family membrane protein YuiD
MNFYYEHILLIPFVAFILSVCIKGIISIVTKWKLDLSIALWSWGMPSAHTAVTVSLTTALALKYWITSDLFAIALAFTVIIIYDAINVRYEAWLHAWALNKHIWERKFRESLWHLPSEAFAWSLVWIFVAVIVFYI